MKYPPAVQSIFANCVDIIHSYRFTGTLNARNVDTKQSVAKDWRLMSEFTMEEQPERRIHSASCALRNPFRVSQNCCEGMALDV